MKNKILLAIFYSLAFFLSVQTPKPVWQQIFAGPEESVLTARTINLLPLEDQHSRIFKDPLNKIPVITLPGFSLSSRPIQWKQADNTVFRPETGICYISNDLLIILFRNLRI